MDGLAWHRRDLGLPACSINWGPWKDVGMAARLTGRERDRWDARGIRALSVDQGLAALGRSLRSESAQVAVLPIHWPVFLRQWPPEATPALLRALAAETVPARPAQTVTAARVPLIQVLAQLPPEDRLTAIQSHVIEQVAQVLALPAGSVRKDRGFADLGMDSLMSVELSNRLTEMVQRPLPATIVFEHPTVESLTAFVAATIGVEPAAVAAAESEPAQTVRDALIDEVERLSEAEAAESLARELDRAGY
jgi:acyl carrier protein